MPRRPSAIHLLLALALFSAPASASGQGPRSQASAGWPPIEAGIHGGYEYSARSYFLGAQMRIPLHPSGYVELVPNGDVIFLPRLKEYMAGVNLVAVSGGRRGGIYAGGGLTWRNTLEEGGRSTRRAPTLVAGARSPALLGSPIGTQVEVRWIRVDAPIKPKLLSVGFNLPLWGRGQQRRR